MLSRRFVISSLSCGLLLLLFVPALAVQSVRASLIQSNRMTVPTKGLSWVKGMGGVADALLVDDGYVFSNGVDGVMKVDFAGDLVWARQINEIHNSSLDTLAQNEIGEIFVGGELTSANRVGLAKLSAEGELLWIKEYSWDRWNTAYVEDISILPNGDIILTQAVGSCSISVCSLRGANMISLDTTGSVNWARSPSSTTNVATSVEDGSGINATRTIVLPNGNFVVAYYNLTFEFNANGDLLQSRDLTTHDVAIRALSSTQDNGYIIAGTLDWGNATSACWAAKVNSNGSVAWEYSYDVLQGIYDEAALDIQPLRYGGYAFLCEGGNEQHLLFLDGAGSLTGQKSYDLGNSGSAGFLRRNLLTTPDNGLLLIRGIVAKMNSAGDIYACNIGVATPTFLVTASQLSDTTISAFTFDSESIVTSQPTVENIITEPSFTTLCDAPATTYQSFMPTLGSRSHMLTLTFDDPNGATTFVDQSTFGHDGFCSGSTCPATVTGQINAARHFDGQDDFISLGNPNALNRIFGEVTITAWIKPDSLSGLQNIVAHGHTATPNGELFLRINNGVYEVGVWNGAGFGAAATIPAGDLQSWVHLAGVYDGSQWQLYRNGVLVDSESAEVGAFPVYEDWAVGARGTGDSRFFQGAIDEVRIYARSLAESEIQQLAQP